MNAYNLMSVLCIFCHLERVCTVGCTVGCTVVEGRKEAGSFVTGDPAWANQSGAAVDAPFQHPYVSFSTRVDAPFWRPYAPSPPGLSALRPSAELRTRHYGAVCSIPTKIRAASFSEGARGWAMVPAEDPCTPQDQCLLPLLGPV